MKLKLACDSHGVKISILLTDDTSLINNVTIKRFQESYVSDPKEIFRISVYKENGIDQVFKVEYLYISQTPKSLIQPLLTESEIPQPLKTLISEKSIDTLLKKPQLLSIEKKIHDEYPKMLEEIAQFNTQIEEINQTGFSLDYSTPDVAELLKKKNLLLERLKLFETELSSMAEEAFPEEPQLVADIVSDTKKHIRGLAQYDSENLTSFINKKNKLMEQSINEEINKLGASLLDKREVLAKLRLLQAVPQQITDEQKKRLLAMDKETLAIKVKHIKDLNTLSLLTERTLNQILGIVSLADKSSNARLNTTFTFFTQDAKSQASRDFWTLCSNAIEENIVAKIEKKESLSSLLKYAASQRREIARLRKESDEFGQARTEVVEVDQYTNDETIFKSVIAPSSFVALANALSQQGTLRGRPKELDLHTTLSFGTHQIQPPAGKLTLKYDAQDQVCAVSTEFQPPKTATPSLDEALKAWQSHYLYNEKISPEELLEGIGKLAFMLSRYYSFDRGTGSTSQWVIRGIVQHAFGVDLKDISLGAPDDQPENGAPFDVYSHVCTDADFYAKQFCKTVRKVDFSPEYKQVLIGKELAHEIEQTIFRLKSEPNNGEKIKNIEEALSKAQKHFSEINSYTVQDFLDYKEDQKSLREALAIKRNKFDFIHTPSSLKDLP